MFTRVHVQNVTRQPMPSDVQGNFMDRTGIPVAGYNLQDHVGGGRPQANRRAALSCLSMTMGANMLTSLHYGWFRCNSALGNGDSATGLGRQKTCFRGWMSHRGIGRDASQMQVSSL